ncbi:MAG: glycosyltransferase family 39 protein [Pseudomonadota bacterium]
MGKAKRRRKPPPERISRLTRWLDESPAGPWAVVLALALAVRFIALAAFSRTIYFHYLLTDERLYHQWAAQLAAGTYASASVYDFAPLPAYIMAAFYKIFSPDPLYFRVLNVLLGALTCLLVYGLSSKVFNRRIAFWAGVVAAVYEPLIFYSLVPLKTSLSVFLFALMMFLFVGVLSRPKSLIKMAVLGLVAGLALNTRGNMVVLFPLFPLAVWLQMHRRGLPRLNWLISAGLFLAGLAAAVSPFMVRNYTVAGEWALTTSQTGRNLYYGNNFTHNTPYYKPLSFASAEPGRQAVHFALEASRRTGRKLTAQEASSYWTKQVVETALKQPGRFTWKMFLKVLALFNRYEGCDHYHIGFLSRFAPFFQLPWLTLGIILPFGMAGLMVSVRGDPRRWSLFLAGLLYALTLVLFVTNTRYRLPLLVILIPFAVAGLAQLAEAVRGRRKRTMGLYVAVFFVFLVVEWLPLPGAGDLTAYYNGHAFILNTQGRGREAIQFWRQSDLMNGAYSDNARLSLAGKALDQQNEKEALQHLERVPDDSYAAAVKYRVIGDIMSRSGRLDEAAQAYTRSLEINAGQMDTRRLLIQVYRQSDPKKAEAEAEVLKWVLSFYQEAGLARRTAGIKKD